MQIFVINLDRKPQRWQRMVSLLAGLPFQRIAAVDGETIDGPENYGCLYPGKPLSRYQRGCILSHRAIYQEFLAGAGDHCCVLEDDVHLSPDFPKFINDESWIPPGCDLIKIETTRAQVRLIGQPVNCLGRQAVRLHSLHFGTAGYIISRRAAEILLETSVNIDRTIDRVVFGRAMRRRLQPVYQLVPALCIQGSEKGDGSTFPEMESSIRPRDFVPPTPPMTVRVKRTLREKVRRELLRPFHQLKAMKKKISARKLGLQRISVPFA